MLTAQDILRRLLLQHSDPWHLKVIDVLSRNPLVLNEDEEIGAALLRLKSHGVRYAPVIGSGGTLCGAVSHLSLSIFADRYNHAIAATS